MFLLCFYFFLHCSNVLVVVILHSLSIVVLLCLPFYCFVYRSIALFTVLLLCLPFYCFVYCSIALFTVLLLSVSL